MEETKPLSEVPLDLKEGEKYPGFSLPPTLNLRSVFPIG